MKKILFSIFTTLLYFNAVRQKAYRVDYLYRVNNNDWTSKLIFNDTSSLYFLLLDDFVKDELTDKDTIGNKLIHHSYYYSKKNKTPYSETNVPGKKFLIPDTLNKYNWIFTNQTQIICSYTCKMAYTVQNLKDTIMVWYAQGFGENYGPTNLVNLPGVVLKAIDQRYALYYLATSIKESSQKIVSPLPYYKIKKIRRQRNTNAN